MSMMILLFVVTSAIIAGSLWRIRRANALDWLALAATVLIPAAAMVVLSGHPTNRAENDAGARSSEVLVGLQIAVLLFLTIRQLRRGGWALICTGIGSVLSAFLMVIFVFGTLDY